MKCLVMLFAAAVSLSACAQGAPQHINPLELDPVYPTIVSANDAQCTTSDQLITSQMVSSECVIRLNRQGYPRVNVKAGQCADLDMNLPENGNNGADWVIKVTGEKVTIAPLTPKELSKMAADSQGGTEEGVYFTGQDGAPCS